MSDKPAFPLVLTETERLEAGGQFWLLNEGLTRRELFAMAAMQGIIASLDRQVSFEEVAKGAVRQAKALIDELDKDKADD